MQRHVPVFALWRHNANQSTCFNWLFVPMWRHPVVWGAKKSLSEFLVRTSLLLVFLQTQYMYNWQTWLSPCRWSKKDKKLVNGSKLIDRLSISVFWGGAFFQADNEVRRLRTEEWEQRKDWEHEKEDCRKRTEKDCDRWTGNRITVHTWIPCKLVIPSRFI